MTPKSRRVSSDHDPPPFKYTPIEVERLERYRPGGYHPLTLGDIIQSRYRVVHKLGYGAYSIIWLCRDDRSDAYPHSIL
ncbi:hypothetical protein EMCG_05578 [[Emmonsia] crescens]|uniref:non-specific serine/threonine protein kinase n=1 Tax=[Emmonsia] crescens TaxID=73230 RepID=A0A0G2HN89_9EURO|nr:hypothetical protein EMCG_05578 [Emmonsia crescens UAMH 3008]